MYIFYGKIDMKKKIKKYFLSLLTTAQIYATMISSLVKEANGDGPAPQHIYPPINRHHLLFKAHKGTESSYKYNCKYILSALTYKRL